MEIHCTRPHCAYPKNLIVDDDNLLSDRRQRWCTNCGMPLILRNRYIPIKQLGSGGFGITFLAQDLDFPSQQKCVVKQLQPKNPISGLELERVEKLFKQEGEILAQLKHAQIPRLLAVFVLPAPQDLQHEDSRDNHQSKIFYLVQDYVDGCNLAEMRDQQGQFSEAQVLVVLEQLLDILKFVHSNNIIHRDIKPTNIMQENSTGKIHLIDFGAVKQVVVEEMPITSSTQISTKGFTSPEQEHGEHINFHQTCTLCQQHVFTC